MIVVADSGPIHYLILLGEAGLLEKLYGVVRIPGAVAVELSAPGAPAEVWGERQAIDLASGGARPS